MEEWPEDVQDRLIEQGTYNNYPWFILHNNMGYRCGYIKLRPAHPWYGKSYHEIDAKVHGGLTFSSKSGPYWVIGFDCAHYMDAPDPELMDEKDKAFAREYLSRLTGQIRSTEYVINECVALIDQAIQAQTDAIDGDIFHNKEWEDEV